MKILPGILSAKRSLNPFRSNRSAQSLQQLQQQQQLLLLQSCRNPDENESQISRQERSDDVPHRPSPAAVMHILVDEPLGVEKNLEKIRNLLSDPEASLIGIAGVGGVGKTTLLKALNNSFLEQRHDFDVVIFASAFYGGERSLQAAIARRLGLPWEESRSKMANAVRISVALKRRRFLLLLDDIVNPVDLEELGVPLKGPRSKSKVVVAVRSEQICKSMGVLPEHVIKVGPMEPCTAWQLFLRHIGTTAPQPYIMDIAKRVAGECGGFPLGLRAVGYAMSTARTIDEWFQSLEALKRSKDELEREGEAGETLPPGIEPAVLSTLKFCYKNLRPEKLRDGISYCALFPKNHSIRKDDLICYWIGEGILEGTHNEGESLVDKLKSFGMLKEGADPEQEVGMDDILRDLILQMKKGEFIAEAGTGLTGIQSSHHIEVAKKVSLMHNDIAEIEQLSRPSELATLNLRSNNRLRKLPDDFFGMVPYLQLLDLSHTGIRETPRGISRLVFLRHLDLSFTKIKSLPEEIRKLGSLVQLILEGTTSLVAIPPGIFLKLTKMAKLNLYCSYSDWELKDGKDVAGENEGPSFNELKFLEQLSDLGITISSTASWEAFASCEKLTRSATRLMVKDCGDMRSMHLSTKFKNLKEANFSDCSFLKRLKIGGGTANDGGEEAEGSNWKLSHLEVLRLKGLYEASIIWAGVLTRECLPLLREVEISFCHELKDVTWVLQLERIERIILDTCKKIEQVINIEHSRMSIRPCGLPRLRILSIRNLPKLMSLWKLPLSLPELEYVKVLQCPQLRSLPQSTTGENMTVIYGEKEWWHALEWKNDTEDCSSWYFQAAE